MLDSAVGQGEGDVPALVIGVVLQPLDLGAEADVASQVEAIGDVLEVRVQLVAQREVHRPVVRSERERVQVVRRVHAGTGVAVLPPRAADGGVLLDHGERDAGALEVDRRADPGDAGADDEHLEPVGHVDRFDVRHVVQADLGADHLAVLAGDLLAHRHAEHLHEHRRCRRGDGDRPAVAPGEDGLERGVADLLLRSVGQPAACRCRPCPAGGSGGTAPAATSSRR